MQAVTTGQPIEINDTVPIWFGIGRMTIVGCVYAESVLLRVARNGDAELCSAEWSEPDIDTLTITVPLIDRLCDWLEARRFFGRH